MKLGQDSLIYPMTYLINLCLDTGEFPTLWKLVKAIGLYKNKGKRDDPKNFRPICLLNPLSKILEKEMLAQMNDHMKKFKLWNKHG